MRTKKIDNETLRILSLVTVEDNKVFLTCGQLERKQYLEVNEILVNIGGTWNRKAKAHLFNGDPSLLLEGVINTGETTPPKLYGYFPTPKTIAHKLVALADLRPNMFVLEPSAGQGAIADCVPDYISLDCIELLPDNVKILEGKGYHVQQSDFLSIEPKAVYHSAIMNPPFSYEGHPQADIDHVEHAIKFLLPGGRVVSIMSAGVLFRENKKTVAFREMVGLRGTLEPLPEGSFKESGTMVNTCILVLNT